MGQSGLIPDNCGPYDAPIGNLSDVLHQDRMVASRTFPHAETSEAKRRPHGFLFLLAIVLAYGFAFTLLRASSAAWHTGPLFSLWFPAAGLRFAFLWYFGPKLTVSAAFSELLAQLLLGEASIEPAPLSSILGILGPCLLYGVVIGFIQRRVADHSPLLGLAPLPFALAAVAAPLFGCLGALPWALPRALESGALNPESLLSSLLVFALGDALGVLALSPPIVWLAEKLAGKGFPTVNLSHQVIFEVAIAQGAAWGLVWVMSKAGYGLVLAPAILAAGWTGIRMGRVGGWGATVMAAVILLPLSDETMAESQRVPAHMLLATLAAVGYLAGALADAQRRVQSEMRRRDRLLYQAERLKTLRGMSVALIHEVSQPLSTIEIEAQNLAQLGQAGEPDLDEVRDTAHLIARKSRDLADLIRHLRRFGERDSNESRDFLLESPLKEVRRLVEPVALRRNITLSFPYRCRTIVRGFEIEVRQALLNLVNNAISASPDGSQVNVRTLEQDEHVRIAVSNRVAAGAAERPGMGIGLIVARSIAEAHGGRIEAPRMNGDHIEYVMVLPLAGVRDD